MISKFRTWATAILMVSVSGAAQASMCSAFKSPRLERQYANCKILEDLKLPESTRDGIKYSINYMMENHGGLQDPSCAEDSIFNDDLCQNCMKREWIEKGIDNDCSFVVNDLQQLWNKPGEQALNRTTGYYVDLCAADPTQLVATFYINGGKGPRFDDEPHENLSDAPSNSSTLAGAFMLSGDLKNDFYTGHPNDYKNITKKYGGIPAIRMIGLNSSNNTTEFDKPLHVSVYGVGLGCAGVSDSTYPVMQKIASHGTSLYMAYAGKEMEQKKLERAPNSKTNICNNDAGLATMLARAGTPKHSAVNVQHRAVGAKHRPTTEHSAKGTRR